MASRKHWLAYGAKVCGQLHVDKGAYEALQESGRSLLPVGLLRVEGEFGVGSLVALQFAGREFARGLASYSATDLRKICGAKSNDIEVLLGYKYLDEVVHRDDMVLL